MGALDPRAPLGSLKGHTKKEREIKKIEREINMIRGGRVIISYAIVMN